MSLAGTGISRGLVVAAAQSTQELILDANVSVTGGDRHRCAGADKRRALSLTGARRHGQTN